VKIYTRTGDTGLTGLYGGGRVRKDDPRIAAYGTVDELNAFLGLTRAEGLPPEIDAVVKNLQNELFDLGAELATRDPQLKGTVAINEARITVLEATIDRFEAHLPPLKQFVLPGGSKAAAALHICRTVCRRAEREVVALAAIPEENVSTAIVAYLNRLSDLLFVLGRAANQMLGINDIPWQRQETT
jgi:cob(I)alamin adenosyltransferase